MSAWSVRIADAWRDGRMQRTFLYDFASAGIVPRAKTLIWRPSRGCVRNRAALDDGYAHVRGAPQYENESIWCGRVCRVRGFAPIRRDSAHFRAGTRLADR